MRFSVKFRGGTTEDMAIASIALKSTPASSNRLRAWTPYSSTVRARAVVKRQWATSSVPSKTPSEVFVFPASITSSIVSIPRLPAPQHFLNRVGCRRSAILALDFLSHLRRVIGVVGVFQQVPQFFGRAGGIVTRPGHHAPATQSHHPRRVVKLVMRV